MKFGSVTKLEKRKETNSKKKKKLTMTSHARNFDVVVIFPIYGQFGAIRKPDFGRMSCKTYIFINSNLLSFKT